MWWSTAAQQCIHSTAHHAINLRIHRAHLLRSPRSQQQPNLSAWVWCFAPGSLAPNTTQTLRHTHTHTPAPRHTRWQTHGSSTQTTCLQLEAAQTRSGEARSTQRDRHRRTQITDCAPRGGVKNANGWVYVAPRVRRLQKARVRYKGHTTACTVSETRTKCSSAACACRSVTDKTAHDRFRFEHAVQIMDASKIE